MTNEELDEARAEEAWRIWNEENGVTDDGHAVIAARLAREGWTPPAPEVDLDLLAARVWFHTYWAEPSSVPAIDGYLAGCTRGREGAKGLVEALEEAAIYIRDHAPGGRGRRFALLKAASDALASAKRNG